MDTDLVIVGVLARIETSESEEVRCRLNAIEGVETFDLPEPEQLGILIEADSLDAAHARLQDEVNPTEGVLGTWPVALEVDNASDEARDADEQRTEMLEAVSESASRAPAADPSSSTSQSDPSQRTPR